MTLPSWLSTAAPVLTATLLLAGCGDAGAGDATAPPASATSATRSAAEAAPPSGATAREVAYRCRSGREATIALAVPDLARLAAELDAVQPCEYDDGLASATVTVPCRSDVVVVHLTASDGRAVQPSDTELCL